MEGKEEDVKLGANKYSERQPLGTAAQTREKDYTEPGPAPLFEPGEFASWSFWRAGIAEFMATFLFLYITILTVMGVKRADNFCTDSVGIQGIAWAFGGMIFCLVYCTAGISGGHINPAVTFGLFLARKLSLPRAVFYMICQCLGAICGAGVVKGFMEGEYQSDGGGANFVAHGYTKGDGLGAEIVGTFVLVYTVFSATDAKRSARDSHVPLLAPLPIGFAVFLVHLATIPITGTGINPARSLGAAIIYNKSHVWDDHWIFWVGPFLGAGLAVSYQHPNKQMHQEQGKLGPSEQADAPGTREVRSIELKADPSPLEMGVLPCSLERKKNEMDGMIKGAAHFHVAGAYTNLMLWKHCKESISGESFKKWRVCGHDWYSISNPEFGKQFCQSHIQLPVTNNLPLTENGDMITSISFGFEITRNVDTNRDRTWGACLDSEGSCGYDTLKPTTFLCYCSDGSSNLDRCPGNITGTFPDRLLPSFIANPNA